MNEKYLRYMMERNMLTFEEEQELASRWILKKDERALKILIESHVKLVIKMAYAFRHYDICLSDLIQEGIVGLMLAAQKYNPNINVRFSGYAKWWIRAMLQNYILKNWSIVRFSNTKIHKKIFFNLSQIKRMLNEMEEGHLVDDDLLDTSHFIDANKTEIDFVTQRLSANDVSLNAVIGTSQNNYQDQLMDNDPTQDDIVLQQDYIQKQIKMIQSALNDLDENEKHVIDHRYLNDDQSLSTIGKTLGFTKERIRQIERKAFCKIRRHLTLKSGIKIHELYLH
ncbi:MAG: RNA polymerase sigma factor RpoH [Holosporales bacterium]